MMTLTRRGDFKMKGWLPWLLGFGAIVTIVGGYFTIQFFNNANKTSSDVDTLASSLNGLLGSNNA